MALLLPNEILSMSAQAARLLTEAGDGDCALLYLALLAEGGDLSRAAARLRWPEERLGRAHVRLVELGLAQRSDSPAPPARVRTEERPPEYSRGDVADALEREPEFKCLYQEMERRLNRLFSEADLKSLYTIYDYLGLPAEVILLLTGFVVQNARRQTGADAFPRMPAVKKEAFRWKRLGVDTVERAENYLRLEQQVDRREWAVLSAVGVTERRAAVEKEREFIRAWVELGLSDQLIRLAYEDTVYRKGAMNWPYMNRILESWHAKGYQTPEQVKEGARLAKKALSPAGKKPAEAGCQPTMERIQKNADWLDQFLEEQKRGE